MKLQKPKMISPYVKISDTIEISKQVLLLLELVFKNEIFAGFMHTSSVLWNHMQKNITRNYKKLNYILLPHKTLPVILSGSALNT